MLLESDFWPEIRDYYAKGTFADLIFRCGADTAASGQGDILCHSLVLCSVSCSLARAVSLVPITEDREDKIVVMLPDFDRDLVKSVLDRVYDFAPEGFQDWDSTSPESEVISSLELVNPGSERISSLLGRKTPNNHQPEVKSDHSQGISFFFCYFNIDGVYFCINVALKFLGNFFFGRKIAAILFLILQSLPLQIKILPTPNLASPSSWDVSDPADLRGSRRNQKDSRRRKYMTKNLKISISARFRISIRRKKLSKRS